MPTERSDASILLVKGDFAYLNGDVDEATRISALADDLVRRTLIPGSGSIC